MIIGYIEEYSLPLIIFRSLKEIVIVILFYVPQLKSTFQYGKINTLNSKIQPLVTVLAQAIEEKKYVTPNFSYQN